MPHYLSRTTLEHSFCRGNILSNFKNLMGRTAMATLPFSPQKSVEKRSLRE